MLTRPWFMSACLALSSTTTLAGDLPLPPGEPSAKAVAAGRELFTMNFARPREESFAGGLGHNGNGLGPLFNETSCVACHNQGGVGGAGGLDQNVELLGIVMHPRPSGSVNGIVADARQVHPAFSDESPIIFLQRSAAGTKTSVAAYDEWRDALLAKFPGEQNSVRPRRIRSGAVDIELVQRNTPALWGVGEIDRFRDAGGDAIRRRLADEITAKRPWITGRAPVTADGEDGWYGWRGQVASLNGIVRGACASELGIQVPGVKEASLPVEDAPVRSRREGQQLSVDLTEEQVQVLNAFVASIPRPVRQIPANASSHVVATGEKLFTTTGCADCHVPDLGSIKGIYSDQLLHDMGEATDDVQAAMPLRRSRFVARVVPLQVPVGGYTSSASLSLQTQTIVDEIPTRRTMEWKTPPLWGVRDSYPYFHDGRAPTLRDAIRMHGGEAERSATEFERLEASDQDAVVMFLESLSAPPAAEGLVQNSK